MQLPIYDLTIAGVSLGHILDQAIEQLGYDWDHDSITWTTHGFQAKIRIYLEDGTPVGYTFGQPCARRCEARESVVMHAMIYIDFARGYTINDIYYNEYLRAHA